MAARKDVELVIRAKNEASKAVDAIGASLKALTGQTDKVVDGAGKTQSALGQLTSALGGLDKALGGVSAGQKLANELGSATAAIGRLKSESGKIAGELGTLGNKSAEAASATAALKAQADQLGASLGKQESAVTRAKAAQAELSNALRQAVAERNRLTSAETAGLSAIDKQAAKVDQAVQKYRQLEAAVGEAEKPSSRLTKSFENSGVALDKQSSKLALLIAGYATNKNSLEATAASVGSLDSKLKASTDTLEAQRKALNDTAASYKGVQDAVKAAAANQAALDKAADNTAEALRAQRAEVSRAEGGLAALGGAVKAAATEQDRLAVAIRGGLLKAFGEQRGAIAQAKVDLDKAKASVAELALQMRATSEPSAALVAAFEKSRVAARDSQSAYDARVLGLQKMRAELRTAGTSYDGLVGAVGKFASISGQATGALDRAASSGKNAASAVSTLDAAAAKANGGLGNVANGAGAAGGALGGAAGKTNAFGKALSDLTGDGRQAMSIISRLRSEVLSLTASYIGVSAAVEGIKKIVAAYQGLEAATSRLNVAFQKGGQEQVGKELDFARRNANRLGIEFNTLSGEYSKFAIATQGSNLEGEKTRKIFLAVAEAARVQKLSIADTQGVFLALSQMASKGRVSMEELRQQLGDRLPGAVQLMAEAVGVGTAELFKLIEQGKVSSDVLDKFADKLNERFGGSLQSSLNTLTTSMGQFANASTQALQLIAESGAADGLKKLLQELTKFFQSADGQAFFQRIGQGLNLLFQGLTALVSNIKIVSAAIAALVGIKIGTFLASIGSATAGLLAQFGLLGLAARSAGTAMAATGAAAAVAGAGATTAGVAVGGLRVALSALGGPVGILIGLGSAIFSLWALSADKATDSTNKLRDAQDKLLDAGERGLRNRKDGEKPNLDFGKSLSYQNDNERELVISGIKKGLEDAKVAADKLKGSIKGVFDIDNNYTEYEKKLNLVVEGFNNGTITGKTFSDALRSLQDQARDPAFDEQVNRIREEVKLQGAAADKVALHEAQLRILAGTASDADRALVGLAKAQDSVTDKFQKAVDKAKEYADALNEVKSLIPSLKRAVDEQKELDELNEKINAAQKLQDPAGQSEVMATELSDLKKKGEEEIRAKYAKDRYEGEYDKGKDTDEGRRLGELVEITGKFGERQSVDSKDLLTAFGALTNGSFKLNDSQAKAFGTDAAAPVAEQMKAVYGKLAANGLEANDGVNRITALLTLLSQSIPTALANAISQGAKGGGGGVAGSSDNPASPGPTGSGDTSSITASKDQVNRIVAATSQLAEKMGVSARDLLAIISYESAGSFNPAKAGPTTQYGQHRGLFQAGEPQAAKYFGSDFQDIEKQIAGFGKYLSDAGVKAGDGLLRLYAAVNAGNVNKVNASDANNGGAPGTVTDKVNNQFGGHIARAQKLLDQLGGADSAPSADQVSRAEALAKSYKDRAKDGEKAGKDEERAESKAAKGVESENARLGIAQKKAEVERQATLEQQLAVAYAQQDERARKAGFEVTEEQRNALKESVTLEFQKKQAALDEKNAKKESTEAQKEANGESSKAVALAGQIKALQAQENLQARGGDLEGAEATRTKIKELQDQLASTSASAKEMHESIGGAKSDAAGAKLDTLATKMSTLKGVTNLLGLDLKKVAETLVNDAASAFDQFAKDVAAGKNVFEAARNAFLKFASDFLRQIAQMIIKQQLFNLINSFIPGLNLGGAGKAGVSHAGGLAGSSNRSRTVSSAWFANAVRYHGGGIAGLKPNEVPAVLERGEEILTQDDPRHMFNAMGGGGGGPAPNVDVKVVNAIDSGDFVSKGLGTGVGQKAILNFIRENAGAVKSAMG